MSLLANVVGFGAFGFATRCFQLGLQKRHMFDGELILLVKPLSLVYERSLTVSMYCHDSAPITHVATTAVFGLLGWGVYELEGRQWVS